MDILKNLNSFIQSYDTILPFSKKKVTFTPFKVKDVKSLSIILQEDNKKLALQNMIELLKNCTSDCNIEELCLADAEFLFLKIRSKSVDEMLNLVYGNEKIQVNISDINYRNQVCTEEISIGTATLVLETPTIKDLLKMDSFEKESYRKIFIKKIIVNNEIFKLNKFVTQEIKEFIENLPLSILPKLDSFAKKQPELYLKIITENEEKEVSGLLSFFIFR